MPSQLSEEVVPEQLVVAVNLPGPPLASRHHVFAFRSLQQCPCVIPTAEFNSEIDPEDRADAGPPREAAPIPGEPGQDLGDEVVGNGVVIAAEPLDQVATVLAPGHRERRDPHPCDPTLGP